MSTPDSRLVHSALLAVLLLASGFTARSYGQGQPSNPMSKLFVSDVSGAAQLQTADQVKDLKRRTVFNAQGTVIETKVPTKGEDPAKIYSTMVYSNGTGAFFGADTRVEIRRFRQEPFTLDRPDLSVEPSISHTDAYVAYGTVGLCTAKLVAGSTMSYSTPQGTVNVRGRKLVIQAEPGVTTISMLDGESTVQAGNMDLGGHLLQAGEQAVIRSNRPGEPNSIEIVRIPPAEFTRLQNTVAMACMAKRTVYFEETGGGPTGTAPKRITAVPVVPAKLPVNYTISPASLLPAGGTTSSTPATAAGTGNGNGR